MLLFVLHAFANPQAAEINRLTEEVYSLVQRNAWSGVERKYAALVALDTPLPARLHLIGAQSAQADGDVRAARERAEHALNAENATLEILEEASTWMTNFDIHHGAVSLAVGKRFEGKPVLLALDGKGFNPSTQKAMAVANQELLAHRAYTGFLPLGRYQLGVETFDVFGGPVVQVKAKQNAEVLSPVLPDEAAPLRTATLVVRGSGWQADQWDSLAGALRQALYDIHGVRAVETFQPSESWWVFEADPLDLQTHGLDLLTLGSRMKDRLGVDRVLVHDDKLLLPPGTIDQNKFDTATISLGNGETVPLVTLVTIHPMRTGPFPVPTDRSKPGLYRLEVRVEAKVDVDTLSQQLRSVPGMEALDLTLEAQEVR